MCRKETQRWCRSCIGAPQGMGNGSSLLRMLRAIVEVETQDHARRGILQGHHATASTKHEHQHHSWRHVSPRPKHREHHRHQRRPFCIYWCGHDHHHQGDVSFLPSVLSNPIANPTLRKRASAASLPPRFHPARYTPSFKNFSLSILERIQSQT